VHADAGADEFSDEQPDAIADEQPDGRPDKFSDKQSVMVTDTQPDVVADKRSDGLTYHVTFELTDLIAHVISIAFTKREPDVCADVGVLRRRRAEPWRDGDRLRRAYLPPVRRRKEVSARPRLHEQCVWQQWSV
jgi:hypothetical protein